MTSRVMIAMPQGEMSGAENMLVELLRDRGSFEACVMCPDGTPLQRSMASIGVPTLPFGVPKKQNHRWPAFIVAMARSYRDGDRAIKTWRPDVLHAFLPLT